MKGFKYIIFIFLLLLPINAFAKQQYGITNYYTDIEINNDNTYNIKEYYNVLFFENSQFERTVNLQPRVILSNGKFISYISEIDDIDAPNSKQTNKTSKLYTVKFAKKDVNHSENYKLKYKYIMGEDLDSNNDIVYITLLDKNKNIITDQISFSIALPTEITSEDVKIYINEKLDETESAIYEIKNNTIEGIINNVTPNDTYSIQILLPNGYFKNVARTSASPNVLLLLLPLLSLIIGIILLKKYKRKLPIKNEDIFKLTEIFDSVEMAYLYKGKINSNDIISVIIYLANNGYISIKNFKTNFKITKVKDYDKDNAIQKIIYDGLFQNKTEVDVNDIEGIFYPYYIDACRTIENKKNHSKMFYPLVKNLKKILLTIICIGNFFLMLRPLYNLLNSYVFATIIDIALSLISIVAYKQNKNVYKTLIFALKLVILLLGCYLLIGYGLNLVIYIIGIVLSEISLYIESVIPIRTIYGNQKLYEVESFRYELASMNDELFEEKIKENNNYFYDMIPYTLVFDLSSWWFNRFSNKINEMPTWYSSSEKYSHEKLKEFINTLLEELTIPIQTTKIYSDELLHQAPNKKI